MCSTMHNPSFKCLFLPLRADMIERSFCRFYVKMQIQTTSSSSTLKLKQLQDGDESNPRQQKARSQSAKQIKRRGGGRCNSAGPQSSQG